MRRIAAALLIACLSAPLRASDVDQATATPKKEKRICRETRPTGSRLPVRACRTATEWAAIDKANQAHADREVDRVQAMSRSEGSGFSAN